MTKLLDPTLATAIAEGGFDLILTANRRLARAIDRHVALDALANGETAWRSPPVATWTTWLRALDASRWTLAGAGQSRFGAVLAPAAERYLWQQIVQAALPQDAARPVIGLEGLTDSAADAYALMRRYAVDEQALAAQANDDDSRFLLRCVRAAAARGERCFEADLPDRIAADAAMFAPLVPAKVLVVGFDRITPQQQRLFDAFPERHFSVPAAAEVATAARLVVVEQPHDELVAAGDWASERLARRPGDRLAIVVPGLAGDADSARRWFAQGYLPGTTSATLTGQSSAGFELSYGKPLRAYPAVATALSLLRFAVAPTGFVELSRLLRSPLLNARPAVRALRLEQRLRQRPDQHWQLRTFCEFAATDRPDWLAAVETLASGAAQRRAPSQWAEQLAACLDEAGWMVGVDTDSPIFQLRRAMLETLNQLGMLDGVCGPLGLRDAIGQLTALASRQVFQPQGDDATVLICGPLEMSGLAFDAVWVTGLDASRWPVPSRPNALLPIRLQKAFDMPDATPEQTLAYWRHRLQAVCGSAPDVVLSHARREGDSSLLASPLLREIDVHPLDGTARVQLAIADDANASPPLVGDERLPRFDRQRPLFAAASSLPLIDMDPLCATILGRWNLRAMEDPLRAVGPRLRGELIHAALHRLAESLPAGTSWSHWPEQDRAANIEAAVARAMAPAFVHADDVLRALLRVEERRARDVIDDVVRADLERPPFEIVASEQARTLQLAGASLRLRIDRIDRTATGNLIVDYKTGRLSGMSAERLLAQQFAMALYALTEARAPAGLMLIGVNRDPEPWHALVDERSLDVLPGGPRVQSTTLETLVVEWRLHAEALVERFVSAPASLSMHPDRYLDSLRWLTRRNEELAVATAAPV